jgi:hypothetical protein
MSTRFRCAVNRTAPVCPVRRAAATLSARRHLPDTSSRRPGRLGMNAPSKPEILVRDRTFHPGHESVTDPLFRGGAFFDPRDLLVVKYEMLRRVRVDRWTVARAARGVALSRTTWYEAMRHWERDGLTGLVPGRPGPRRRPDSGPARDHTTGATGRQKGGAVPTAPSHRCRPGGTSGTSRSGTTGWPDGPRARWPWLCGRVSWPGFESDHATCSPGTRAGPRPAIRRGRAASTAAWWRHSPS